MASRRALGQAHAMRTALAAKPSGDPGHGAIEPHELNRGNTLGRLSTGFGCFQHERSDARRPQRSRRWRRSACCPSDANDRPPAAHDTAYPGPTSASRSGLWRPDGTMASFFSTSLRTGRTSAAVPRDQARDVRPRPHVHQHREPGWPGTVLRREWDFRARDVACAPPVRGQTSRRSR